MRIWIDLANSPHVPFFRALIPEFTNRGHHVEITARDFAETVALAEAALLNAETVGGHGGKELSGKAGNLFTRALQLHEWMRGRHFDLAVSHNSYSQILSARARRLPTVTLMDYEHQPANHLAFRLATRVIVPAAFPVESLRRYGAKSKKVRRYSGTKEDVYLADFQPDPGFSWQLNSIGVEPNDVLVVMRPPAVEALYHRFENQLFDDLLDKLCATDGVRIVLLARSNSQRKAYEARRSEKLIVPSSVLDGTNLIAASDLVISAGGTMNREAAALGVPAATIYAGKWAAVDEELCRTGRLIRISSAEDFVKIPVKKKVEREPRRATNVRSEVIDLILSD
jgi:uncharacterized protein